MGPVLRLVIGHEHSGGCLRRAAADGPRIDDGDGGAATCELVRNRAADHAGAGDKTRTTEHDIRAGVSK